MKRPAEYSIISDSLRSSTLNTFEENGLDRRCIPIALGVDYYLYDQHTLS